MFRFSDFMIFELTYKCNLKCQYCYLDYDSFKNTTTMDINTFKKTVENIAWQRLISPERRDSVLTVVLHGGEPTLIGANILESMVDYFKKVFDDNGLKYYLSIQTNGIAVDESFLPALKKLNNVGISFDGVDNSITLRHNSQDKVKKTIDMLEEARINYGIVSVISKQNINKTEEIFHSTRSFVKFVPVYDTNNVNSKIELTSKEYFEIVTKKDLERGFYINKGATSSTLERIFLRALVDIMFNHSDSTQSTCSFKFCGSGIKIVAIQPEGSIHNCDRWKHSEKNKKEYFAQSIDEYDFLGISQLTRAIEFSAIVHNIQKEEGCDSCYARYSCQWDCQAMHYSKHGSYGLDKNKTCYEIKEIYNFIEKNLIKILKDYAIAKKEIFFREDRIFSLRNRLVELLKKNNINISFKESRENGSLLNIISISEEKI